MQQSWEWEEGGWYRAGEIPDAPPLHARTRSATSEVGPHSTATDLSGFTKVADVFSTLGKRDKSCIEL